MSYDTLNPQFQEEDRQAREMEVQRERRARKEATLCGYQFSVAFRQTRVEQWTILEDLAWPDARQHYGFAVLQHGEDNARLYLPVPTMPSMDVTVPDWFCTRLSGGLPTTVLNGLREEREEEEEQVSGGGKG
jgi:hypothetical protein